MEQEPISFKNYCTCGGHAWQMNGRPQSQPHMDWCPQREEYAEWWEKFGARRAEQYRDATQK